MGKVLLTGGAGFIGAHTAMELLQNGYDIAVADDYVNSSPESMRRVKALSGKDFPVYDLDVADEKALEGLFAAEKIDAVIHFAGLKAVAESISQPIRYYRNNLCSTMTLLSVMERFGVKKLVFSSSATVYGTDCADVCREDQHLTFTCSNPYGRTKYIIEQILRDVAQANPDWSVVLLRYFNPVGAHVSGMLGEDPNDIPNNLMPRVMRTAMGKMDHLGVFGTDYPTPDGTCQRDYIHVMDLARGHLAALRYMDGHTGAETVNLGTGVPYSVLDIIHAFEKANGVKLNVRMEPRRPGDLPTSYADPHKALELFGWKAEKSLEDMCRDAWRWQQMNPDGYATKR